MVFDNHTLMSSCVLKRETSWLDLSTAKIGKSNSWQTVSQNSRGYVDPYVLSVLKRESRALMALLVRYSEEKMGNHVQTANFQVLSVHDDVVEPEQNRKPVLDHGIIGR